MPLNQPIQKRYFTISEVAKMLDIRPSTLRFWEKEFKQLQPKTNARGKRAYKQEDIELLRRIYDLVKVQGLTLEGARKAMSSRKGESSERDRQAVQAAKEAAESSQAKTPERDERKEEAITKLKKIRQALLTARASHQG